MPDLFLENYSGIEIIKAGQNNIPAPRIFIKKISMSLYLLAFELAHV